MSRKSIPDTTWQDLLNRLVLKPKLAAAARAVGVSQAAIYLKIRQSIEDPASHQVTWLDQTLSFADAVALAKKLSIIELDRSALQLAIEGHSVPRYHDGKPVFKTDLQVAADALTMDEMDWIGRYGSRRRDDVFARSPDGTKLIQEMVASPPNPQLVNKLLSSLIPSVYSERVEHEHHVSGGIWLEGQAQARLPAPSGDAATDFGLTSAPVNGPQRPTNTLAVPRPCASSAEFDTKFRKKLLREIVMFYDGTGKLLPPLPGPDGDVVVAGTIQARAFEDAGMKVEVVRAETLLDEGYENDWLRELAPDWKPPAKPKAPAPTAQEREEVAAKVQEKIAQHDRPLKAGGPGSENIGRPNYGTGGARVVL